MKYVIKSRFNTRKPYIVDASPVGVAARKSRKQGKARPFTTHAKAKAHLDGQSPVWVASLKIVKVVKRSRRR